ncbi:MAG: hypothetical protein ABR518_07605, partial [Actinomycetota bacterium]
SRAKEGLIRPALVFVLMASGLKLIDVPTLALALTMLGVVLVALPIWGIVDASMQPGHVWETAGARKKVWIMLQALGTPFGLGFGTALAYFFRTRRKLDTAAKYHEVAVRGSELEP